MKAISLWQPWASLMAAGAKQYETRSWPTRYRGDLVICAARTTKAIHDMGFTLADVLFQYRAALECPRANSGLEVRQSLPFGCALCVVTVYDCVPSDDFNSVPVRAKSPLSMEERLLGNYEDGRYAWLTRELRRFKKPFPFKGKQGFFEVPDELVREAEDTSAVEGDSGNLVFTEGGPTGDYWKFTKDTKPAPPPETELPADVGTDLFRNVMSYDYGIEINALMKSEWSPTPWMIDVNVGEFQEEMRLWCSINLGPESSPMRGHEGSWRQASVTMFGRSWFGFRSKAIMCRFMDRFPEYVQDSTAPRPDEC